MPCIWLVNRIKVSDPHGSNKGHSLKFQVSSQVCQETTEEGQRTYQPKHCEYNNKGEENNPKTQNDKNVLCFFFTHDLIEYK